MPAGTNYNYGNTGRSFEWWQVISQYRMDIYDVSGTTPDILDITNEMVFDQTLPYGFNPNLPWPETDDSPSVAAITGVDSGVALTFKATMWLMFKPDNGQWVPVRSVPWYCSGSATNTGSGWTLVAAAWTNNPPDFDAGKSYPTWTNNIASWGIYSK